MLRSAETSWWCVVCAWRSEEREVSVRLNIWVGARVMVNGGGAVHITVLLQGLGL